MSDDKLKILLVEDDPIQAEIIGSMLSLTARDIILDVTFSLRETLSRIKESEPDLILLDLELTDSEGIETFHVVHRAAPHIPIVVLTATGNETLARETMRAGAQDYLIKWEMDQHQLVRTIRYAIARKRSEEESRNLQKNLHRIAEVLPDIIVLIQPEIGRITFVNDQVTKTLGYSREEAQNLTAETLVHPTDLPLLNQTYASLIESNNDDISTFEYRVRHRNGGWRWIEHRASIYSRKADSTPDLILCAANDITDRVETIQNLAVNESRYREGERRLKLALDAAGMGIWEWDIGRNLVNCDDKAAELFGVRDCGLEQMIAAIHPDDQANARDKIDQVIEMGSNSQTEFRISSRHGPIRWIECHARMFSDRDNQSQRLLCAVRDITEKKRFEAELHRSQRLESIGALASGIAHDLNNVMAPIFMALHTLQQRFTDDNSQRWLSLVYKSAERGRDLIQQMLTFAKGTSGKLAPLQLHPLIADLENMLAETMPPEVILKVEIPDDLWTIIGDVTQLYQVLMNLSINAKDAMPDGGTLTISAENVELNEDKINRIDNAVPGAFIKITVSDTGAGILPDIIDNIFDPFFTTKEKGLSSGLGLSIVLGIVRGYGGFVNVESEVGNGTTFSVYLPAQKNLNPDSVTTLTPVMRRGRGETILVVDDEDYICEVIKNTLECYGYKALVASDGEEAIILFQQNKDAVKVVLTDLELPDRDGLTTIREIKRLSPEIVIIATSSIRSTDKLITAKQAGINTFLTKPFTAEKLLGTLTSLLGYHGETE